MRTAHGTIVEVFEWVSQEAIAGAHQNPGAARFHSMTFAIAVHSFEASPAPLLLFLFASLREAATCANYGRITAYTEVAPIWSRGRLDDHPDRTRRRSGAVGAVFSQAQGCRVVESPSTTLARCDGAEADRSGCLSGRVSDPGLVQAYCVFSGGGATCEAAAAPSGGLVSGSAKNLPTICATSGELMKL